MQFYKVFARIQIVLKTHLVLHQINGFVAQTYL